MKKLTRFASVCAIILLSLTLLSICVSATESDKAITLTVKNGEEGTNLSWNALEDVSYYAVIRLAQGDAQKAIIAKPTENTYTDRDVTSGKLYAYRVVPVFSDNSVGTKYNNVIIRYVAAPKIVKKVNLYNGIAIGWLKADSSIGYYIYRNASDGSGWKCIAKTDKNTNVYTDKNVNDSLTYSYAVRSACSGYLSCSSNIVDTDFIPAPKINKVVCNDGQIGIRWTKVEKAAQYIIFRATSLNKTYTRYADIEATKLVFFDNNVQGGVDYGYIVYAVDDKGNLSGYQPAAICRYLTKPVLKSAVNVTNGITISWTQSVGAQRYAIYRKDSGSTAWKLLSYANGQTTLTATDKTVKNGGIYTYTVRAVFNNIAGSFDENGITARYLSAPANLKVVSNSKGNVLSWTANSLSVKYYIYRKAAGESWKHIATTMKNYLGDVTAEQGKIYLYTVRAYINESCFSAPCTAVLSSGINPNGKMVALTYDDGPSNSVTNDILDTLEKYGGKATFFVVGQRINGNYQPMQRAVKMGCEIGNHTYSHIDLPSSSSSEIREEISATDNLVKKYTGVTPKLARAPGGATDSYSASIVGKPFMYWSVDTRDWESRYAPSIVENVKYYTQDGSIILMHDIYDSTAEASDEIIPWLVNQGYQLVTVSEMMYYRGINLQPGVTYYDAYR